SFLSLPCHPARSTLFPYTTLFRSQSERALQARAIDLAVVVLGQSVVAHPPRWEHVRREERGEAHAQPGRRNIAPRLGRVRAADRSEEHTSELQSLTNIVCRLLLEK